MGRLIVCGVAVSAVRATFRRALWAIAAHWPLVPSRSLRSRLPGFRSSCQVWMGGLWAVLLSLRTAALGVRAIVRGWALWAAAMPLPLPLLLLPLLLLPLPLLMPLPLPPPPPPPLLLRLLLLSVVAVSLTPCGRLVHLSAALLPVECAA